jgi:sugar-specific transcriptional regulator TrmB
MYMSDETIKQVLKNFGLTDTEAIIYLFLAKHEALTGTEIAGQIKKDKAQVFRTLKSLQTKGLAESTIEVPVRYTPVSIERVLESTIKAKKDEAAQIERTKQELLNYWKNISKNKLDFTAEKFMVIEGRHKVYSKIAQMVKETKNQLSTITTVNGLLRADQFGLYDAAFGNPQKSKIQFRFLTEFSSQNLKAMKVILKKMGKKGINFKCRNPDLGLSLFPQMVIRDNEETVFFLAPRNPSIAEEYDEMCLWTNCKDLVQAFSGVFEDSWMKATNIEKRIVEVESGKPHPQTLVIENAKVAKKKYDDALCSAKDEIFMVTSTQGLLEFDQEMSQSKGGKGKLSIKIMAPITRVNQEAALRLLEQCEVRHLSNNYLTTTIVDAKNLFQFNNPELPQDDIDSDIRFENTIYSNNLEFVEKARNQLKDIWKNCQVPTKMTLELINKANKSQNDSISNNSVARTSKKLDGHFVIEYEREAKQLTEQELIDKIIKAEKHLANDSENNVVRTYGTNANAIVHPPDYLNLPDLLFHIYHMEKSSTYGVEDAITINLWLKTENGFAFVPVALITDNPDSAAFFKKTFAGIPAEKNVQVVKKDELQIRIHANTLFAGWTISIPLIGQYVLPPSCLLIEGQGNLKINVQTILIPSGYRLYSEFNGFEAFVTFLHPLSKYSGPGTDGYFGRDTIMEFYPP